MSIITDNQLQLYQSIFQGREDVYAIRWEKDNKSGYMPAYEFNWDEFNKHKAQGGTFKTFKNKKHQPFTREQLKEHLSGKQTIGVYPLLPDNTSFFIAADFDEQDWLKDSLKLITVCESFYIPAYLERSRSGNGGHIWVFFEKNYPAWKSRKILYELLKKANIISSFDIEVSFDRLFPNQDYHSGIGLGNLIALPLNGDSLKKGNSCFIDTQTLSPFEDQWKFLSKIKKISIEKLDELYNSLSDVSTYNTSIENPPSVNNELRIILDNEIILNRNCIPSNLINFLKDNLNFLNREFFLKKKLGKNTYNTEVNFKIIKEQGNQISLPRGFIGKLIRFCKEQKIEYIFEDRRKKAADIKFKSNIILKEYQSKAFEVLDKKDFGVIVAPPGSGKTIIGLELITRKKQPALIVVHRKQLFDQWIERIQTFLSIPKNEIGQIENGKQKIGKQITVAMIQSLEAMDELQVGTVIIDECHHIPAKTFREAIAAIKTYYLYGLTATPKRKNNDEDLIYSFIGDTLTVIENGQDEGNLTNTSVNTKETNFYLPFDHRTDNIETLFQALINDTSRNQLIVNDVYNEAEKGKNILILTERKAHIKMLYQFLSKKFEVIAVSGEDPEKERISKLHQIKSGYFQIIISTGQFFGEGIDIGNLNCLFLTFPFSFEGKLVQYVGRVQRNNHPSILYDYRDIKMEYLEKLFKNRNRYYKRNFDIKEPKKYETLLLKFESNKAYINNEDNELDLQELGLVGWEFKEGICWKIKVLKYIDTEKKIFCEIINYNLSNDDSSFNHHLNLYEIKTITFRSIDTSGLLLSTVRKNESSIPGRSFQSIYPVTSSPSFKTRIKNEISFDEIEFNYGYISFKQLLFQIGKTITFRIDNEEIRPEFDAIRTYFKKVLRVKSISYEADIEMHTNSGVTVKAYSREIDKISSELIESVKFSFVKDKVLKNKVEEETSVYTNEELMSGNDPRAFSFYKKDTDLFDAILNAKKSRHYFHLKYLSSKHKASILKLRFIINPFSFIFLLEGKTNYHIVWESLDSKEATYIWHIEKNIQALELKLKEIELIINQSRIEGKINYLSSNPDEFNRVFHDYSDHDKGFILWKGMLDERIF
jgi:superfamily II DNA or RNA helicase